LVLNKPRRVLTPAPLVTRHTTGVGHAARDVDAVAVCFVFDKDDEGKAKVMMIASNNYDREKIVKRVVEKVSY
jgi:hypothetical protein